MGEETLWEVCVWHSILEVEYRFRIQARSDQRARIGAREFFTKEQLEKRILRVHAYDSFSPPERVPSRSTWEPL